MRFLTISITLGLLIISFQNCSDVKFTKSGSDPDSIALGDEIPDRRPPQDGQNNDVIRGDIDGIDDILPEVRKACSGDMISHSQTIVFADPQTTCSWGTDGNLSVLNGFFRGRIEQRATIHIPENAVICDMSFDFVEQDNFIYDDHFLINYNSGILAASYGFYDGLNSTQKSYYSWSELAGDVWDPALEGTYCIGSDDNLSSCSWPDTDLRGRINMEFNRNIVQSVTSTTLSVTQPYLEFVTFGDNDELDCEHSDVEFEIEVKYAFQ